MLTASAQTDVVTPIKFKNPDSAVMENTSHAKFEAKAAETFTVNAKTQRSFTKMYKTAYDTYWVSLKDGGSAANCFINGVKHRIYYDNRNRWIGELIYLDDTTMPQDIRTSVRRIYFDFSIYQVIKIEAATGAIYYVYMDNPKEYLTISYADGEIKTVSNYKKL